VGVQNVSYTHINLILYIKFGSQYGGLFENAWMSNLGNIWGAVRISIPDLDNQQTFTHTVLVCEYMWTSTIPGDNIKTIKHQSTVMYIYTYLSIDPLSFRKPDGRSPIASPMPKYDWMNHQIYDDSTFRNVFETISSQDLENNT
jgi:hypothetical protein